MEKDVAYAIARIESRIRTVNDLLDLNGTFLNVHYGDALHYTYKEEIAVLEQILNILQGK